MTKTRYLSLTAWLTLLTLGATVPLLAFGGFALHSIVGTSRALADRGQQDTVRALALAVDGEVRSWKAALAALAESTSARLGQWEAFYEEARKVGAQHEGWVVLTVETGEQLFNTLLPYGAPLHKTSSPETIDAIFREGKPIVSDLIWGQNAQRYLVAVAVPVMRGGKVANCLTLNFSPDRLTRLLLRQQLPSTWVAAINDRRQRVVARSLNADERIGKPTVEWFTAATRAANAGTATGPMTDGRLAQIAFVRLQEVPWIVALAVPVMELQSEMPLWTFIAAGALLSLLAVGMAVFMGRKVTRPVRSMARASEQVLRGSMDPLGFPTAIEEVKELQQAFARAAATARANAEEREVAAERLRQLNQALEERVAERTAALRAANDGLQAEIGQRTSAERALDAARSEALREKSRLEAVMQALPVGVALVDAQGGNIQSNAAYEQVWGGPRPPARTVADYAAYKAWWAESGQPVQPEEWASARAVREKRAIIGQLLQIERFDGTRAFVLNSAAPICDTAGAVIGAAVAIQDITDLRNAQEALRRSETLYRAIGESIEYGVWVCAPDGRNTYASESFLAMVGLTQQECSDFGWGAVLHPDDADRTIAAWKECVRTQGNWDIEHRFRGVDGRWHDVLARGVPVKDERGAVLCWAGINLNISRLKRAEAALRQLNAELEQRVSDRTVELAQAIRILEEQARQLRGLAAELTLAEQRERRRLADFLHDELQQILVAMRLRAYMLGRGEREQDREASQEIVALVEEAIGFTRSLMGELSPPSLLAGELQPALEWLTRWMRERHKFAVRLRPSAVPPPALQQDVAVLVYQSVRELLLNAVKHSGVTTAEVGITRDGTALRFEVSDAGVGLDSASLRVTGGTEGGFGLLGIRERLESVGGHLDIASTPGQGSRFVLTVPLPPQPEEEASSRPRMEAAAEPDTEERSGRQLRVLLVDDHVLIRRAVATMIAAEPDLVVVGEAADGKAAVALTRELEPDVVVMDISMPVLDGIQATRAIRQAHPSVRVIGLSMLGAVDQPAAMREAGAAACVSKSDSAETLLAAIRGGGTPRE